MQVFFAKKTNRKFKYVTLENLLVIIMGFSAFYIIYISFINKIIDYGFSDICNKYLAEPIDPDTAD
jgi:hypothetical protein